MTDTLLMLDPRLHVVALVMYALAASTAGAGAILQRPAIARIADASCWIGVGLHVASISARWIAVGHGPYVTKYENLSSYALATVLVGLIMFRGGHLQARAVQGIMYTVALMLMAVGLYTGPEVVTLPPTFSGIWLVIHVCFYFVAFAAAATCLASAVLIIRNRSTEGSLGGVQVDLDKVAYRFGGLAFAFWGVGMLAGSVWAYHAWGRFWAWDPVETWSLATWLSFGIYLHLRRFYSISGRRGAIILLLCVLASVWTLFGTSILTDSIHAVYFQ